MIKRSLLILAFVVLSHYTFGQLSGTGTFADPYSGVFEGDVQWSIANFPGGKIYINGDIYIDNEVLIIDPGMTIVFVASGADIIINGTGTIYAAGTAANRITFTADHDNDGNYGESGETWGHIVFDDPTEANQSILEYCIIEFGDVRSGSNTTSYGGGLFIKSYNNLIIKNCILRNNRASHGGAILLLNGSTPAISNTLITNNFATMSGGGIYSQARSGLTVTNTIITQNASGSGGGGGIFIDGSDQSRFVNCTFALNTTTSLIRGSNVHFYSVLTPVVRPRFINSIIWGSDNSIDYSPGTVPAATDFIFSAIQDQTTPASSFTDCIDLHSDNNNNQGPNFNSTDGSDWSLRFVSPCRDAGTDSYTGVIIPAFDYAINPKVYVKDIGAYEYQYSRWKTDAGSTDWSTPANWHGGVPTSDRDIVIPAGADNYPVSSSAPDLAVGTNRYFIMEPGARLTLNSLTNNGNTLLQASETEHSSLITGSHTGTSANIEIYLRSGTFTTESGQYNRWHYIASPFTSLGTGVFTGTTNNLAQWVESSADPSLIQGWIAYDGYNYGTGTITGPTFNNLTPGIGYNYYYTSPLKYTLSGQINTANVSRTLHFTNPSLPTQYGLNLTGNPFPSGLDWDAITSDASYPANTSKVLHYTKDDDHVYYSNGIGSIPGMNGIIPPMQGFFVKTYDENTPSLTLAASARVHDNIPQRYKGKQAISYLRLSLFSGEYYSDNTVVRFDEDAKEGFDYDFDAVKYFISDKKSSVYTVTEGKKYAINGQPFPEETLELPLHLKILTAGNHKIKLSEIEELSNYRVRLKDNLGNFTIDLKVIPEYTFTSPAGTISDRFTIIISDLATSTELPAATEAVFRTWHAYGVINIVPDNEQWDGLSGNITLTDISGRRIATQGSIEFHRGTPLQIAAPQASGIYIIEIEANMKRWTGRVVVRK